MALLGNYSVLNKNPGRAFAGSTVADSRAQCGKSGPSRGRFAGWAGMVSWHSTPTGARPPVSWIIAITDGGIASHSSRAVGSGVVSMSGAKNIVATGGGSGSGTATGALIAQIIASGGGSGSGVATLFATLNIVAAGGGSGSGVGSLVGVGRIVAAGEGELSGSVTVPGLGQIIAATGAGGVTLTADEVASAVWSTGTVHTAGTLGHALNLVRQLLANKTITDPVTGVQTFYDDDDVTELLSGALWQDAAGTIEYSGAGAERRDRLQ